MKSEVHLNDDSQPFVIESTLNRYQKGQMYCVMQNDMTTHKFSLESIFCVTEYPAPGTEEQKGPYNKVEILTFRQSQPMLVEDACRLEQREGLYCVTKKDGTVIGFPLQHIKRVVEPPTTPVKTKL